MYFRVRGALGSFVTLASNGGVVIGFLVGSYFSYENVPKVLIVFPILFIILYIFFPESPWYLIKENKFKVSLSFEIGVIASHDGFS